MMSPKPQSSPAYHQARLDYMQAQQGLLERDLEMTKLTPDDVANLEIIVKADLTQNGYTLNELEDLRLKNGRIYGKANVTSVKTSGGDTTRHHTAAIAFHTDYTFATVFDDHRVGGDEWRSDAKTAPGYSVKFTHGKMYFNDNPPFEFSKGTQTYLVKQFFPTGKPLHKSLLVDSIVSTIDGANFESDNNKKEVRKTYLNARKHLNKTFMAETGIKEELIELFGDEDTGQTRLQINPKFAKK